MYMAGKLWNDLSKFVPNSANIESFKRKQEMYKWSFAHTRLINCPLSLSFLTSFVIFCTIKARGFIMIVQY